MAYIPKVGDVVLTYAYFPYTLYDPYPEIREYCCGLADANIGGCHLGCDDTLSKTYFHSEMVNPDTWQLVVDWCAANHNGYEVYRLGDWGNWQAAVDYQQYVYDHYWGDRYRVPWGDWDYVIQHGYLSRIDNQRHSSQSWYQYFHINSFSFRKCYWYCISQTFESILHGWWKVDPVNAQNYCTQDVLSFFKNTLGGQMHDWLQGFQRVY